MTRGWMGQRGPSGWGICLTLKAPTANQRVFPDAHPNQMDASDPVARVPTAVSGGPFASRKPRPAPDRRAALPDTLRKGA